MSDTIEHVAELDRIRSELERVKTDLVVIALFFLNFPFVLAQKVMGYAKGTVIKILQAVIAKSVQWAIRQERKLSSVLILNKDFMKTGLRKTLRSICETHANLILYNFEFPDSLYFFILCLKSQLIITFFIFEGICRKVLRRFHFALLRVSSFVEQSRTTNEESLPKVDVDKNEQESTESEQESLDC